MLDFRNFPGSQEFQRHALAYLRGSISRFFGGSVKFDSQPLGALRHQHGLDIAATPHRGVYIVDNGTCAVILGRVLHGNGVKAAFSLQLRDTNVEGLEKLFNVFEAALAVTLTRGAVHKFADKPHQYGDELIELTISKYFGKGYYDHRRIQVAINLFHDLANTRFEGRNFTTGLVLTRSHYAYAEKKGHTREGRLFPLETGRNLSSADGVDKRFWYLSDGQTSFFLANRHLELKHLFITHGARQSLATFVDDYTLSKTIKGGDVLFRVSSQSEWSITGSEGIEFGFREGRWRARNLDQISKLVRATLQVQENFVQGLLFYVFYLSRRRLSSILWVPMDVSQIEQVVLSQNRFTQQPFSILDEMHTQSLIRLLSSDGASIVARDGTLISFGCVVDTSKLQVKGIKGTGESVASLLGSNGLAVKISQDGTIKLYPSNAAPLII
ncbi:hypothetical protein [Pseudacidovorax intermedius]|uniref:hypothetical protein n=1 Tax=Pseudacidovorax intermedius TaxID=433924 RepID=UPI000B1E066F|nr:hypothetical protein [Pseudacidovorax intermedius]